MQELWSQTSRISCNISLGRCGSRTWDPFKVHILPCFRLLYLYLSDHADHSGAYRIVHDKTQLALDEVQQLAIDNISPPAKSQVWDLAPSASSTATINYSIFNHPSQNPLYSGKWRLIFIPPVGPDTALAMPSPMPTIPTQFLLMDTGSLSMLGVSTGNKLMSVQITDMAEFADLIDNSTPKWDNIVSKHMVNAIDVFRKDHGNLVWRLYPESWAPADGTCSPQSVVK